MPELPEVESFRQLLLPLVSTEEPLVMERLNRDKIPPKKFPSDKEINEVSGKYRVSEVLRKGKLIGMVLKKYDDSSSATSTTTTTTTSKQNYYLFLHMGMTGRLSTPDYIPELESLTSSEEYPPPHSYLKLKCGKDIEVAFSDPRKFGSIQLLQTTSLEGGGFGDLAYDALSLKDDDAQRSDDDQMIYTDVIEKMVGKSIGIKAMLLDQKRIVSGVGNWVADEVLYQIHMHPDQTYLTTEQAKDLVTTLSIILNTAVDCLKRRQKFPSEWLFHYRWQKKRKGRNSSKSSNTTKSKKNISSDDDDSFSSTLTDSQGRKLEFVTSGGRTSAIVPAIQQKQSQGPPSKKKKTSSLASTSSKSRISKSSHAAKTSNTKRKRAASQQERKTDQESVKNNASGPADGFSNEIKEKRKRSAIEEENTLNKTASNQKTKSVPKPIHENKGRRRSTRLAK